MLCSAVVEVQEGLARLGSGITGEGGGAETSVKLEALARTVQRRVMRYRNLRMCTCRAELSEDSRRKVSAFS